MVYAELHSFWRNQARMLLGQTHDHHGEHIQREKTQLQALLVGASSLLYLLPAYAFHCAPHTLWNHAGSYLFVLVSLCSATADGSMLTARAAPYFNQQQAETLDRWTATTGGAFAVAMFLGKPHPDPLRLLLEIAMLTTCVLPLHFSRVAPVGHNWTWAGFHMAWHLASAATVSAVCPHLFFGSSSESMAL